MEWKKVKKIPKSSSQDGFDVTESIKFVELVH